MDATGDLRTTMAALRAQAGLTGRALREAIVAAVDGWLSALVAEATGGTDGVALVAVGGYGRREPAFGSDLDLVLLHHGRRDVAAIADCIWYPVWDTGLGLDHSVRTVDEALAVGAADLKAALGMLDVRHIAGDGALSATLRERTLQRWRATAADRLPELRASCEERAQRAGELAFLLEPDLKESRGGLRDVHTLRSIAASWSADPPRAAVLGAHELLLDVRGELHRVVHTHGRPSDRLRLQDQDAVAAALGDPDADVLMGRVSLAARTVAFALDETWRRVSPRVVGGASRWRRSRTPDRIPLAHGVVSQSGEVVLARDIDPAADAGLVLRAAAAAAGAGLPLAMVTLERLADCPPLPVPWPPEALDAFLALLGSGHAAVGVLESLDHAGLLVGILPEWDRVRCKPQRNAYHRFTVDRHLCEAAANAAALTRRVARPDLLLLGALLHDIGKGWPGDHTEVGVVVVAELAPRFGLPPADVEVLVSMVRHHLLLADAATRRDLDDPATITLVAAAVGDRETLELLAALTEADSLATGPAAWSDWKAGLVADLAARTAAVLATGQLPTPAEPTRVQRDLLARGDLALIATKDDGSDSGHVLTVVYPDAPGVLAKLSGVLALHRVDIRSVDAVTEGASGLVSLRTTSRHGSAPSWEVVRDDLRHALDGTLHVTERLQERAAAYPQPVAAPPSVRWVDDASERASVVEVRTPDGVGVLHRITLALAEAGLDVRSARCTTLGADVVDAFYVSGAGGGLVEDPMLRADITTRVLAALTPAAAR